MPMTMPTATPRHSLWPDQRGLEKEMRERGFEACAGQGRLAPTQSLSAEWLPRVTHSLEEWRRRQSRTRGPKPVELSYIKKCDPAAVSMIALRLLLKGIADGSDILRNLAIRIGVAVESEQQCGEPWSAGVHFRVGATLLENIFQVTGAFDVRPNPRHLQRRGRKHGGPRRVLCAKAELISWLTEASSKEAIPIPALLLGPGRPQRAVGRNLKGRWYRLPVLADAAQGNPLCG
jgi:hypothetical protein